MTFMRHLIDRVLELTESETATPIPATPPLGEGSEAVSYTHLTLPTILLV